MEIEQKRILLTGATGGIGTELARVLSARGARLALLGRDVKALRTLSSQIEGEAHAIDADLVHDSQRASAVAAARDALELISENAGCIVTEVSPRLYKVEKPPRVTMSFSQDDIKLVIEAIAKAGNAMRAMINRKAREE